MSSSSSSTPASSPLTRFPLEVRAAVDRLRTARDTTDVQLVLQAALRDFMPKRQSFPSDQPLSDHLRLLEDLGFDSLAVAELVFFFEDLFGMTIQTQELIPLRTVGELRVFISQKLGATPAAS